MTVKEIRSYLKVNSNNHHVKTIRVFYGRFLGMPWLIQSFKVPQSPFKPKYVPPKKELQRFYRELTSVKDKTIFLLLATSGLRFHEIMELKIGDVDLESCMIRPKVDNSMKKAWVSFFNKEAGGLLANYLIGKDPNEKLFSNAKEPRKSKVFRKVRLRYSHITPKVLREWFCCEMGSLGVPDRYIDAFCGRVPRSVLARHYTDYSPKRLKEIYDKAGLKVLN
jgi:integrase